MSSASTASRRPRVLQCITHLALGGAERIALNLVQGLSSHYDFAVFSAYSRPRDAVGADMLHELHATGTPLYAGTRWPMKAGGMIPAGGALARAIGHFRPDVIHLHTEIPEAAGASVRLLAPALSRARVVRTIHNSVYWHPWRRLGCWCDRQLADAFVAAVSPASLDAFHDLRRQSAAKAPPAPPRVIANGLALSAVRQRPERRPTGRVRLLFAGRFEWQKGADLLPDILSLVRWSGRQELDLTIHGSGSHAAPLHALARTPPKGWRVTVLEPIDDLTDRMSAFDLLIMPSRFEGCSLIAIEAQSVGLPVVATDAPGLRTTLPDDHPWVARAGDAADFARALRLALGEPERWPALVRQSREHTRRHFDAGRMCDEYRQLFQEAMASC